MTRTKFDSKNPMHQNLKQEARQALLSYYGEDMVDKAINEYTFNTYGSKTEKMSCKALLNIDLDDKDFIQVLRVAQKNASVSLHNGNFVVRVCKSIEKLEEEIESEEK